MENDKTLKEAKITKPNQEPPVKSGSGGKVAAIILSSLALLLALTSCAFSYLSYKNSGRSSSTFSNFTGLDGNSANFTDGSIADVANSVAKSVVSILTETRTMSYFGGASTSSAAGTGMIITADGYVLTNKHVISGANKIYVVLSDGTTYENVSLITADPLNDVAVLKIADVSNLTPVALGDSKTISIGQQVIAIGNALGQYQNTVTSGIVSGTGRTLTATDESYTSSETLSDMIQTDAAINSGNSGGPLINASGEVIGINTAVYADGDGIGFAIPISSVKGLLKNIIDNNSTSRAYAGLYYVGITTSLAKSYNLPVTSGAYVYTESAYSAVISGSPADKAGIKNKDIIISVNGVKIGEYGSFSSLISEYAPGETVHLTILREGNEIELDLTLGEYKSN